MAQGKLRDDGAARRKADKARWLGDDQCVEEREESPIAKAGIAAARGTAGPVAAEMIELQHTESGHAQGLGILFKDEPRCRETVHHDDQRRAFGPGEAVVDFAPGTSANWPGARAGLISSRGRKPRPARDQHAQNAHTRAPGAHRTYFMHPCPDGAMMESSTVRVEPDPQAF